MTKYKQLPLQFPPEIIEIPLSNTSIHAGKYKTIVDITDSDLAEINWYIDSEKYAWRKVEGKFTYIHRVILERMLGRKLKKGEQVDHISGDGLDNRRENLRLSTQSQNTMNTRKRIDNTSGYKGVIWQKHAQKWRARIQFKGKIHHLGYFDNPGDAHKAYCEAATKYFGEFANYGD